MHVFVEQRDGRYENMFLLAGHSISPTVEGAELVCFTGGSDVSPYLYGENPHDLTSSCEFRDKKSLNLYEKAKKADIPMVGICRGAQLLNVLSGGSMYQHVSKHAVGGTHEVLDMLAGKTVQVSSTHHQMMVPNLGKGEVLADASLNGEKEGPPLNYRGLYIGYEAEGFDAESVMYLQNQCLCFQPHPEFFYPGHECFDLFFEHLNHFMKRLEK
jgi:carbamoylphosphate synthase small subunit